MSPTPDVLLPTFTKVGLPQRKEVRHTIKQSPPKNATKAWESINDQISPSANDRNEADRTFWWRTTGVTLAILLENARYSFQSQCQHLHLYRHSIVPELGARPSEEGLPPYWKSFMTDHYCPLEFSWEWNCHSETPMIRYSFESIGEAAGTPLDPLNQHSALRFVNTQSAQIEGCDLSWFWHLWNGLVSFQVPSHTNTSRKWSFSYILSLWEAAMPDSQRQTRSHKTKGFGHESRCFLALDLGDSSMGLKAYFMPCFKARDTGRSQMSVICDVIESLPDFEETLRAPYDTMMSFINNHATGAALTPEIVATDCVAPSQSRIKIYFRTPLSSLESALSIFALGGFIEDQVSEKALEQFRQLWSVVWSSSRDHRDNDELALASHRTGGLLYYVELRPGRKKPAVKIYLPLRHQHRADVEKATALQTFLRSTSRTDYSDDYLRSLRQIIASSPIKEPSSFQTYLTCMFNGDGLRVTSYIAPVVYQFMSQKR